MELLRRIPEDADYDPARVAALDPLHADQLYPSLPAMNAQRDVGALARTLSGLLPPVPELSGFSHAECLAAMRDLGLFLCSLRRHDVEPVGAVPEVESVLLELSRRTDMVPRDTVHHYTEMNPTDTRQRMFTGDPRETHMMDSVRITLRRIGKMFHLGEQLSGTDPRDADFARLLNTLADEIATFDSSMNLVNEKLPPKFFYDEMRPFFEEFEVGGNRYLGPTAGHVPLAVLDMLLWESDLGSRDHNGYRRVSIQYTLPAWRALYAGWEAAPSLTTRLSDAMAGAPPTGPVADALRDSAVALTEVLRLLVVFRGKHVTYARRTYLGDAELDYQGSGGGSIDLLQGILNLTRQNANLIRASAVVDAR